MYEQLNLFQFLEKPKEFVPGDWIEKDFIGRKLTFDEIANNIGNLIVMDKSTASHEWYKVVLVEKIIDVGNRQRRLVYYDGCKQRGLTNEMYFCENLKFPAKAYELNSVFRNEVVN